jgi:GT2 family glycosyltransferase
MNRFWNVLIRPIIEKINAEYIIEIGSHTGLNTKNILEYCSDNNARMASIDPFPKFNIDKYTEEYGDKFEIFMDISLNILPKLNNYDVILIDGDHNWYTVYNELKIIEKTFKNGKFPLIFLHDIGWPYARRDLYYNPEDIPEEYRQPYDQLGVYPGKESLVDGMGLNQQNYNHAIKENNPQNGILTAVEDFINESDIDLHFDFIPIYHGLGILYIKNQDLEHFIEKLQIKPSFLTQIEDDRIKLILDKNSIRKDLEQYIDRIDTIKKGLKDEDHKINFLKNELNQKVTELNESKLQLKIKDDELIKTESELKYAKNEISSSKQLINLMKENEERVEHLQNELNTVLNTFHELGYINNQNRSLKQRIISTFPSVYILLNRNNGGLKTAIKNIRGYKLIKKNHLLDIGFYLSNNSDVRLSGKDPILHYIYHGVQENRDPSTKFNGEYYLETYPDVKGSNLNPLVHYALYGKAEGRKTLELLTKIDELEFKQYSNEQINDITDALMHKQVSIIVPIYNAYEDTKKCIESVLEHTNIPYELILIDDCSPDERIGELLDEMEQYETIKIIRNQKNHGFVKNVNIGMKNSKGDVVLLNSDTIVTPKWLQKLVVAAYSNESIGTVTPLSNAAGAFSVPEIGKTNEIPEFYTINTMASMVEKISDIVYLEVPTGNGFCMFIKRDTIDDVGLFDEENFGKGYGEENDFSMRAIENSWKNILDDSTYIYHKRSASFSSSKTELMEKNRAILDKKYPSYTKMVRDFIKDEKYAGIRSKIKDAITSTDELKEKRILYVLHSASGGTPATNEDLMRNIQKNMDCYVLTSSAKEMMLWSYKNSELKQINRWKIKSKWSAKDFHNPEFRDIYFNVLIGLKIDIVHIRHLIKHSFDLPGLAKMLGIPTIISFHDFYFVCPSHNLLDENFEYCAGTCTEGYGQCFIGDEMDDLPILKDFVPEWRKAVSEVFKNTSKFVTTTNAVKDVYTSIYPELYSSDFKIIEHGRDFNELIKVGNTYEVPSADKPVKILFPGNLNIVKGSELIKSIKKLDVNNRLEFHFMGMLALHSSDLENYGVHHGAYQRDEFCNEVAKIKPSFIGIMTICSETYCHTLSEAWDSEVPVLCTKLGAIEERVNQNGGGWFLDYKDPQNAYNEIIRISNSQEEYIKVAEEVKNISLKSTGEMAEDYMELYSELLNDTKTIPNHFNLKKSLMGNDGFVFLVNDTNNEIRQHFDQSYINRFNAPDFNQNLKVKKKYLDSKKIDFYFYIIPDKSVVCKDFLPFNVNVIKRNSNTINNLTDFAENMDSSFYFKIDSHINYQGGKELSYSYLNNIDPTFTREKFESLFKEQINEKQTNLKHIDYMGDLLSQRNWSYSFDEKKRYQNEVAVFLNNKNLVNKNNDIPKEFKFHNTRETEYYHNPESYTDLRVLILRDSSLTYLKDSLSVYFKDMLLYWDHWIFNKELVEWYKPDLVIEIRTERFLENVKMKIE